MMKTLSTRSLLLALAAGTLAWPAAATAAVGFKPSLLLDARGAFEAESKPGGGPMSGAVNGQLFFVPAITLGDDASLLPLVAILASGRSVSIVEDRAFSSSYSLLGRPQYRRRLNGEWAMNVYGAARHSYNQQNADQPLGTNLYDHEEYGGGGGFEWKGDAGPLHKWEISGELLRRHYVNWRESLAVITNNLNYYDKDYWGPKFSTTFQGPAGDNSWSLELDWQHKRFADCLVVNWDGTYIPGSQREDDWLHVEAGIQRGRGAWLLGLNLQLDDYHSNQAEFDLAFLQYINGFYAYQSGQLGGTLTWRSEKGASATLSASAGNRAYIGRYIRHSDGTFAQGTQADFEQRYGLGFQKPVWGRLALVGGVNATVVQSNTEFAGQYEPNYSLYQASLGVHYQY
jgi:hypothetical protein